MEAIGVVDFFDEGAEAAAGVVEIGVGFTVGLLGLQLVVCHSDFESLAQIG
ncbi:MAG TPA: hypothetical protein VKV96_21505 [Roseiarcus sp.]|nr:hypothetical protein [Roseiarcus sp.]